MDEQTVRDAAEQHGKAVVARDLRRAGSDLTPEAQSSAGDVMAQLPKELTSADVVGVRSDGGDFVATIRYAGTDTETTVESRWADRGGTPKILELTVV